MDGAIPANDGKFQTDYSIFSNQYKNKVIRFGKLLVQRDPVESIERRNETLRINPTHRFGAAFRDPSRLGSYGENVQIFVIQTHDF